MAGPALFVTETIFSPMSAALRVAVAIEKQRLMVGLATSAISTICFSTRPAELLDAEIQRYLSSLVVY